MKLKFILVGLVAVVVSIFTFSGVDAASVRGYFKSNGTYVNSYYRSSPDVYRFNNYSYYGNYNPYSGKIGTNRYSNLLRFTY
jgi:hypothetical protein